MSSEKSSLLFVPRSVVRKKEKCSNFPPSLKVEHAGKNETSSGSDTPGVKEFSSQQRWPDSEEPVCVVCGKYGEYICDQTDEDVCSIECKLKHLQMQPSLAHQTTINSMQSVVSPQPTNQTLVELDNNDENFDTYYATKTSFQFKSSLTKQQCNFFREKLKINVNKETCGLMLDFSDIFAGKLLSNITENSLDKPTVVQMQAIPTALSSQDILVSSETTSGKTACFLIPIIQKIQKCIGSLSASHQFCQYPMALVMAPTRELCMQIEEQAKLLSVGLPNMKTCLLIGGVPMPQQRHRLRHKIQLVIGTPGRIIDILSKHEEFSLSQIKIVVLDEVDVMLHMGFQNQIEQVLELIPGEPQYMMFSATVPAATENLAQKMMNKPIYLSVGKSGAPSQSIEQLIMWVDERSKKKKLFSIMDDGRHFLPPVLVFVESKIGADMLCDALNERYRLRCDTLHSDKTQDERSQILSNFLTGSYDILIATNLMGRGINLLNVKQVILFDMPKTIDEYVHQIGRAGSLSNRGYAITFINNSSKHLFLDMKILFDTKGTKLPDEVRNSPYVTIEAEKRERQQRNVRHHMKSKRHDTKSEDDNINAQSLIEILTKKRKRK